MSTTKQNKWFVSRRLTFELYLEYGPRSFAKLYRINKFLGYRAMSVKRTGVLHLDGKVEQIDHGVCWWKSRNGVDELASERRISNYVYRTEATLTTGQQTELIDEY